MDGNPNEPPQFTPQTMEGKPQKQKKERTKKPPGTEPKRQRKSTKKDDKTPGAGQGRAPVNFPPYSQHEQLVKSFIGGVGGSVFYASGDKKDVPSSINLPFGIPQMSLNLPSGSDKPEFSLASTAPVSVSSSRIHATLPPKKSLSPSRMAMLTEQLSGSPQDKSFVPQMVLHPGGPSVNEKQSDRNEQQKQTNSISQIIQGHLLAGQQGTVSSSGGFSQLISSSHRPSISQPLTSSGQIDQHGQTVLSSKTRAIVDRQDDKIQLGQHRLRMATSHAGAPVQFMHPGQISVPRQFIQSEGSSEQGHSQGNILSQGISADTGGLLRQQLMQKLHYQVSQDSSEPERSVFSAYKHAPSLPTSEHARGTPSPQTLLQQQHQARLEKHREEAKMKGYTTGFRIIEEKPDLSQPPRIHIPQEMGLKGALSPNMNSPTMKELYPQPAHQDHRLSPASFPVSTIRKTPSPAHMSQEKRSPAPPSALSEQDKVQPVNLSLEGHVMSGNRNDSLHGYSHPQSSSLPVTSNVPVKREDFTKYQSYSPLPWLVSNQQHHDNSYNPWQQQHYHTPDFSEISRDISPTPMSRQDDKGSPDPGQIISSILAGGQKQSEILRQTLTSGLPPNVQISKSMSHHHQGLLPTSLAAAQTGQISSEGLVSLGQPAYNLPPGIGTQAIPTVRRFEGEIVRRVPQIPSPHSTQRLGRIEKGGTSPHRQVVTSSDADHRQIGQGSITESVGHSQQIRYTVKPSVSPVGKHDERHKSTPSPKSDRHPKSGSESHHGLSALHSGILPSNVTLQYGHQDVKRETLSPKPGHISKDAHGHHPAGIQVSQGFPSSIASSVILPPNAGPIRQPLVNLVRIPVPTTMQGDQKAAASTINQLIQRQQQQQQLQQQRMRPELPVFRQEPPRHALPLQVSQALSQLQKEQAQQGQTFNPFTFPSKPSTSVVQTSVPAFGKYHVSSPVIQSQLPSTDQMEAKPSFGRQDSDNEMPRLDPIPHIGKVKMEDVKEKVKEVEMVAMPNPFNMRLVNLANLPTSSMYRSTYRAHSLAVHRAKSGSIQSAAKSLDLLRQNLQKFINKEIDVIIQNYMEKFFKPGINNIRLNNGETSVQDEHIQAVCRQILEEAKKMYITEIPCLVEQRSVTPTRDIDNWSDSGSNSGRRGETFVFVHKNSLVVARYCRDIYNWSDSGSNSGRRSVFNRKRRPSDTDSEKSHNAVPKKKRGRPQLYTSGRVTPSKTLKPSDPVKREGPKWDPDRITLSTLFVMGARANKALGLGATRGRIYIKHPDLFKYSGDQDDKQWLYENHRMPATGGKAYMLILEDIRDLAESDEYRDSPGVRIEDLVGFTVPDQMIEKVKGQMNALRTDLPQNRVKHSRSRSNTPSELPSSQQNNEDITEGSKALPFANFTSPKMSEFEKDDDQVSTADTEIEFLSGADNEDQNISNMSPFNITGGFDEASPCSDIDGIDENTTPLSAPFEFTN